MRTRPAVLALVLVACGREPLVPSPPEVRDGLSTEVRSGLQSDADGLIEVDVEVLGEHRSFMVTGSSELWVSLEELRAPDGSIAVHWEDWWGASESLTDAFFGNDKVTSVNWPVREQDGPLVAGTWTAVLSTLTRGQAYESAPIDVVVHRKADPDPDRGTVVVHIVWAEGVDDDPTVVDAVETAVERWRQVWGTHGVTLAEEWHSSTLDPDLPFTYKGDDELGALSARLGIEGDLFLIVGELVKGDKSTFGVASGVPGPLHATPSTYVVTSWLSHAGKNAVFNDEEIRMMGETMAHEAAHYAGLFHPVEWNYDAWDALDDTVDCTDVYTCEEVLGSNVMYPYPVCWYGPCTPAGDLTPQQRAVLHGYTGTL